MALKLNALLLLSLLFINPAFAVDYTQDANCVGAWLLDESSGDAIDACDTHDGTVTGDGVTQGVSGKFGTAYDFAGTDDFLDMGDVSGTGLDIEGTAALVCSWIEKDTVAGTDQIARKNAGGDIGDVTLDNDTYRIEFELETQSFQSAASATSVSVDIFTHVCGSYDGVEIVAWFNGVDDGSNAQTDTIQDADQFEQFTIAVQPTNLADFDGAIDEVIWFNDPKDSTVINDILDNGIVSVAEANTTTTLHNATIRNATITSGI